MDSSVRYSGVILIFYNISQTADISIGTISGGLYQKMISSATGLVVGVVAFMGYNFLLTKIDNFSLHLQKGSTGIYQRPSKTCALNGTQKKKSFSR
ncbi:MAG: MotA/TolQ/ExbB proton channel family protein [Saprospiraceae bacterium]|uniref:MotA/TolQ/ExbB proton channel family protein n=1 Tax=Candidatus Opimibacter skivensis TaxID=2982028 RepID=A0A9D7SVG7_9BACT|nr:MotA/TolQ/ExbB proton channel family protein [Candidatus Opimibacter skivensis]